MASSSSSSSSATSLASIAQLRWQSVRQAESMTFIEQENIDLRKQIVTLKKSLSDAESMVARSKGGKGKRLSKAQEVTIKQELRTTYGRLDDIKHVAEETRSEYMFHSYGIASQFTTAKRAMQMMMKLLKDSVEDNDGLKGQIEELTEQNIALERQTKELKQVVSESTEPLKNNIDKLQLELSQLRGEMALIKDDAERKQQEVTALQEEHDTSAADLEVANNRCDELTNQMNLLLEENKHLSGAISLHEEEIKRLNTNYGEQMNIVGVENSSLKLKVADLEEQIKKMRFLLQDNKTHFGKFMDLKNENANLKDKMKIIESSSSKVPMGQPAKLKLDTSIMDTIAVVPPGGVKWPSSITPRSARRCNIDPSNSPPPSPRSTAIRKNVPAPPILANFEQKILTDRSSRENATKWLRETVGRSKVAYINNAVSSRGNNNLINEDESSIEMDRHKLIDFNIGDELTRGEKLSPQPPSFGDSLTGVLQENSNTNNTDARTVSSCISNGHNNGSRMSAHLDTDVNISNSFPGKLFQETSRSSTSHLYKDESTNHVLKVSHDSSTYICDESTSKEIVTAINDYSTAVDMARTLERGSSQDPCKDGSMPVGIPGLLSSKQNRDASKKTSSTTSRKLEV